MTKVLIVGGGVAALEGGWGSARAPELVQVEPDSYFVYRPLLVTGEARSFPLERLAEAAGARLANGMVELFWKRMEMSPGHRSLHPNYLLSEISRRCPRGTVTAGGDAGQPAMQDEELNDLYSALHLQRGAPHRL